MQLVHLVEENCPTCGARTKACEQSWRHTNGAWQEYRTYECGFRVEFIPNFMKSYPCDPCQRSTEYTDKMAKRELAIDQLMELVRELDIDGAFRDNMLMTLRHKRNYFPTR